MNTKMYVGNLSFDATEADLRDLFGQYGGVSEVFLPTDRESGRPRGFAFVTMETVEAMNESVEALHGQQFMGRGLTVNEARPREERPYQGGGQRRSGGGGGGRDRGGYGGGGGGRDRGGYGGGGGRDRDRGGY